MVALIIDTLSIQTYVFGSNKLKENIGGSYIIEELVYKEMIPKALAHTGIDSFIDMSEWKTKCEYNKLLENPNERVEIGYIGGGNAILIFRNEDDTRSFIRQYSKQLLEFFPGLKTAFGIHNKFEYQKGDAYKKFRWELNQKLLENRNFSTVQVTPLKHGIVEDCPWTNEAQEVKDRQSNSFISQMAYSRINLVETAQKDLCYKFKDEIGDHFTFTKDLEKLGQPDDKGYVAIVHADGNGMGKKFIECDSLEATRKLSAGVAAYADAVMKKLMKDVVDLFSGEHELKENTDPEDSKIILPIRPLIIGGDDITFVCEGRLGVYLAEKLLKHMHKTPINGQYIHACAGVAIVHTKYPFYKAYQLTEELMKRAKIESRKTGDGSWMDFMISSGGFSGSLEDIIRQQFTVPSKKQLKNGPYRVDESNATFSKLQQGMAYFSLEWPRNKVKDLRDALRKDQAYEEYFLAEIKARGLSLPDKEDMLWKGCETPYYDMIELIDFYPQNLLK